MMSRCYSRELQSWRLLVYSTSERSGASRLAGSASPRAAPACARSHPPSPSRRQRRASSTSASVPPSAAHANRATELVIDSWKDWFPVDLYGSPWDLEVSASRIPELDARKLESSEEKSTRKRLGHHGTTSYKTIKEHVQALDHGSRHVIQLLQERYLRQTPTSADRVTTKRCLSVLNELLNFSAVSMDGNTSDSGGAQNWAIQITGRAERARAIFSLMQRFEGSGCGISHSGRSNSVLNSDWREPQHQGLRRKREVYEIPRPTRGVYQTVLMIYAEEGVPSWALETVRRMAELYARHGYVELKPGGFHWNCVLLAWENLSSSSPSQAQLPFLSTVAQGDGAHSWDKPFHAAKVFLDNINGMDDSCYNTIMRICGHGHRTDKARELGANVAVKVWQETIERYQQHQQEQEGKGADAPSSRQEFQVPDLSSHFYAFFLQAIRALPLSSELRDAYYQAGIQRALEQGKVNAVIVNEFLVHNRSSDLFDKYIGPYYDKREWGELKPALVSQRILERMPELWRDRADGHRERRIGSIPFKLKSNAS